MATLSLYGSERYMAGLWMDLGLILKAQLETLCGGQRSSERRMKTKMPIRILSYKGHSPSLTVHSDQKRKARQSDLMSFRFSVIQCLSMVSSGMKFGGSFLAVRVKE